MRYNDTQVNPEKEEKKPKERKVREKPRPGEYDGEHLKESKDIPWRR